MPVINFVVIGGDVAEVEGAGMGLVDLVVVQLLEFYLVNFLRVTFAVDHFVLK